MDFILAPADPARQRALPDDPGAGPHGGACAWRHHGTLPATWSCWDGCASSTGRARPVWATSCPCRLM